MNETTKQHIKTHLAGVMRKIITRRLEEPFGENQVMISNPFGYRLVPLEVWKGAKFERSFVTTLGQGIFEQLAKIIAEGSGAIASNQHDESFRVCTWRIEKIDEILKAQRENRSTPDWNREVSEILALNNERFEDVTVKSDLYILRENGKKEFYSFKTVKPNLDQTERAKRDMLRLVAGGTDVEAYFALPFNPAGEGEPYRSSGFTIPYKLLNLDDATSVLIGASLWNKIGASDSTYSELLDIFEEVGQEFTPIIRRDYFGLQD
ncbi:TdeIII family type II restriction endonuclease [Paenibacillus macquariensis]|uniref:type II site-specific deoxyribonuclease n=1 Tax=Paenibacillus macquariensis TaxID=948756 RepID=A0ABY1KFF1_9BACL|nr:TdeIII family type II restriction endonuclease [Paenibacillus macquariensis]MEC0093217.1 TdeIII family type II restriction endonuclease [Paenibacillus macquariensis]OAB35040.1 restriction endonuclease [Paenibacillus macquariensis subsp. macquariensis]SIR62918.1 Type II restriction endonuclease, TdeIII [Paenibacillus macquariensis]